MLQSLPSAGGVFPTPDVRTVKKPNAMAIRAMAPMTSQATANNVTGPRTVEKKQNDKKIAPSATAMQEPPLAQPQNQQLTSDFATDTNRSHVARSQSQRLARTERAERAQERIDEVTIRELRKRDASVRKHEQAHARVGGARAGTPQYEYTTGPDGRRYVTGGYVALNARPKTQHPKDKLEAAELTARAALAPVDPSPADRLVAAAANQMASRARVELRAIEQEQAANEQQAQKAKTAAAKDLEAAKSADKNELKQNSNEDRKKNKGDTEDINANTLKTGYSVSKPTDAAQTPVERPQSLGALQALIVYQRISRMADTAGAQKI